MATVPMSVHQKTLKSPISCAGVGLHSNCRVSMTLRPAEADTGIVFRRTDLKRADNAVRATYDTVLDGRFSTTIGRDAELRIGTVEHLMAAFAGLGVDNAVVDIDGPEVPIMDGSAAPFVFLIECAGLMPQRAARRAIEILKPIVVAEEQRSASLLPADGFAIEFELVYDNPIIASQTYRFEVGDGAFKAELARARTFCLEQEVDFLRSLGLARGGSLDNAVVVSDERVLNEGGLRHDDEFVRHKVLDCLGDLYLAGGPIRGRFRGVRSGHALNHRLLEALFADPTAWRSATLESGYVERASLEALAASA